MSGEMNEKKDILLQDDLKAMLKELEQEVGIDEINRQLEEAIQHFAEKNPNGIENKILRIQKGSLEEILMPEKYADFRSADNIAELLHTYFQEQTEEAFSAVLIEMGWCMMNEGAVLVPTIMRDGRMDMPLLNDDEGGDWIPLFTSPETAKAWPEEADIRPIGLEMAMLLAITRFDFKGVVLNPGTPEAMPLDRMMLEHMERACNETRKEEALLENKRQKNEPTLLS